MTTNNQPQPYRRGAAPRFTGDISDPLTSERPVRGSMTKAQIYDRLVANEELLRGAFRLLDYCGLGDPDEIAAWFRYNREPQP